MTDLFPYQLDGARWLAERTAGLLADPMGLGKSAQAVRACDLVAAEDGPLTVGVVCPASLRANWHREFERFGHGWNAVIVESYDKVARGAFAGIEFDVLILDEAHYLKSRTAKRTKAIYGKKLDGAGGVVDQAKRVWLLTGTPAPNAPDELWTHLRAVMPDAIVSKKTGKPANYWTFAQRYCVVRDNGFGLQIVKGRNLDELKRVLAPHMLRRKKDDVLKDLPPIRFDTLPLDGKWRPTGEQGYEIDRIAHVLAKKGAEGLAEIAPHVASLRRVTGLAKVEPTLAWIKEWFEAGGGKIVVFAHHRDVIHGLEDGLSGAGVGRAVVDGSTPADHRQELVDHFQADPNCKVFIGQIQAAGVGLTLTAASDALFVESSWVPAENSQAAMRIHRIGQNRACLVRFATLAGSIDEQIQTAVARKTEDIVKIFGEV